MNLLTWWSGLSRQYRNSIIMLFVDLVVLAGALLRVAPLQVFWETLTGYMPDFYEPLFLQFIALVRGMNPGAVVASGVFLSHATAFLSLVTVHLAVSYGIGFLFQKRKQTTAWSIINYLVLLLVLFTLHLFLVVKNYRLVFY